MMNGKTTRRNFLQQTGLWAGAFAFGGSFAKRAQAAREKELNILYWEGYNSDDVSIPSAGRTVPRFRPRAAPRTPT